MFPRHSRCPVPLSRPVYRALILGGLLLVFRPMQLLAQKLPIQFGLEGGVVIADVVGDDTEESKSRTTGFGGVTMIVQKPGSVLGFQTGLQLVGKGSSFSEDGLNGSLRFRYLELPLMFRLSNPAGASGIVPALTVGGTVGMRIGCSIAGSGGGLSASVDCDDPDIGDFAEFNRFEAGLAVGGEVAIPSGQRLLIVPMVRYTRGLTSVIKADRDASRVNNSVIMVGVGVRFRR